MSLAERWYKTLHIKYATFLFDVDPETKYIFMVFRVGESFLTQKQNCITQKVGLDFLSYQQEYDVGHMPHWVKVIPLSGQVSFLCALGNLYKN